MEDGTQGAGRIQRHQRFRRPSPVEKDLQKYRSEERESDSARQGDIRQRMINGHVGFERSGTWRRLALLCLSRIFTRSHVGGVPRYRNPPTRRCLLVAVRCPPSAVRCPLSAVRCPLSAVRCPLSAVCCPLSAVPPLSAAPPLYAVRYCCPSAVCCPLKIKIARIFKRPVRQPDLPEELDDLDILRVQYYEYLLCICIVRACMHTS